MPGVLEGRAPARDGPPGDSPKRFPAVNHGHMEVPKDQCGRFNRPYRGTTMSGLTYGLIQPILVFTGGRSPSVATPRAETAGQRYVGRSQSPNLTASEREHVLDQFDTKVRALKASLDRLYMPDINSLFRYKSVSSSNEEAVTGRADTGATVFTHHISNYMPAGYQQNRSVDLNPIEAPPVSAGDYTMSLTVGEDEHTLDVNVAQSGISGQTDNNEMMLRKIAQKINAADDRLYARVVEKQAYAWSTLPGAQDMTERTVHLEIEAKDTGTAVGFSIIDSDGDLAETLQLDLSGARGTESRWRLNGSDYTSQTNDPTVDNGHLTLHLLAPTDDTLSLEVTSGRQAMYDDVYQAAARYNDLMAFMASNFDHIRPGLFEAMGRDVQGRQGALEAIGIDVTTSGLMSISKKFVNELAGNYSQVRTTLDDSGGLFPSLSLTVDRVIQNGVESYARDEDTASPISPFAQARALRASRQASIVSAVV